MTDFFHTWQVLAAAATYGVATLGLAYGSSFPARDWLLVRIGHLTAREGFRDGDTEALLGQAKKSVRSRLLRASLVQAGWRLVHEVEDEQAMHQDEGEVRAALESIRDRLGLMNTEEAPLLVTRIESALEEDDVRTEDRALLREAQAYRHYLNDSAYEDLATLMTKATFLAIVGLAFLVILAHVEDRELYFVLGAAGGLMSRLMRILKEKPASSDYGATWSTLILSPVSGALAGWVGIALVAALGSDPVSVVDDRVPPLIWDQGDHVFGLGLAFLLGFSERLFSGVVEASEERFTGLTAADSSKNDKGKKRKHRGKRKGR
jgi:hypothetical protein